MKNRTDAELVAIYSETGDENAFSEIMSRYGKMVHGVCRKYVQDIHEAEDLSQMVFMVLTEKAKSLKEGKALSPWLYGVAKNLSLQALARRVRRIRHAETLFLMESMREGLGDFEDGKGVLLEHVNQEFEFLSPMHQQAILLRYLKGYSEKESALIAGCRENTISKRASEGLAKIRANLSREIGHEPHAPGIEVSSEAINRKLKKENRTMSHLTGFTGIDPVIMALGGLPDAGPAILRIFESRADANRLYAMGWMNGIYVSRDGGRNWTVSNLSVKGSFALGVSQFNADHLLLARDASSSFSEGRIILSQSLDGGATWTDLIHSEKKNSLLREILFSPADPDAAYLRTSSQILRYDLKSRGLTEIYERSPDESDFMRLKPDPVNPERIHLAIRARNGGGKLLSTDDGGKTWSDRSPKGNPAITSVDVDPSNGSRMVLASKNLYLTGNGGNSWAEIGPIGSNYVWNIAFDPANQQKIYASESLNGLKISHNGGLSWTQVSDSLIQSYARDIAPLLVSAVTPGLVLVGTCDGLYRSEDGGESFTAVHGGLTTQSRIIGLKSTPGNPSHLVARTQSRAYFSDDYGKTWRQSSGVESSTTCTTHSLAVDSSGKTCLLGNLEGPMHRSLNGGASFEALPDAPQSETIVADPSVPGRFYGASQGVQISEDGGKSWSKIEGSPNWVWTIAVSPADSNVVYASGDKSIYRLVVDEKTGKRKFIAANKSPEKEGEENVGIAREIFPDPKQAKRAWATSMSGLWLTEDGGASWKLIVPESLANPYVSKKVPDAVYVSNSVGKGFYLCRGSQSFLLDENLTVNAYVETDEGLLLGTESGLYKLIWN